MTTRREKDRSARRAIGWGAAILIAGFFIGAVLAFVPAASGWALDPPFGLGSIFVIGATLVGVVGLGFIVYGFVQLARSRPPKETIERDRERRRLGPYDREARSS